MTRRVTLQLFVLVSLVAAIGDALETTNSNSQPTSVGTRDSAVPSELGGPTGGRLQLREGMKLTDQVGELRETGGRVAFYPDGASHSLQLLENLALERISRDLDQPDRKWSVTGMVTEFKGGNFLLLHRAVLKARPAAAPGPRP